MTHTAGRVVNAQLTAATTKPPASLAGDPLIRREDEQDHSDAHQGDSPELSRLHCIPLQASAETPQVRAGGVPKWKHGRNPRECVTLAGPPVVLSVRDAVTEVKP